MHVLNLFLLPVLEHRSVRVSLLIFINQTYHQRRSFDDSYLIIARIRFHLRDYLRRWLLYLDPRLIHHFLIRPLRLLTEGGLSHHYLALRHGGDSVHLEDGAGCLVNALDFPDLLKLALADLLAIEFK